MRWLLLETEERLRSGNGKRSRANQQRDAEIAEANWKAAEAQARAEKLERQNAPRHIDATHEHQILTALKPFAGAKIRIWIQQDKEAHDFGQEVGQILQKAGWNIVMFSEGVMTA